MAQSPLRELLLLSCGPIGVSTNQRRPRFCAAVWAFRKAKRFFVFKVLSQIRRREEVFGLLKIGDQIQLISGGLDCVLGVVMNGTEGLSLQARCATIPQSALDRTLVC